MTVAICPYDHYKVYMDASCLVLDARKEEQNGCGNDNASPP
jgi:hypothetical protein